MRPCSLVISNEAKADIDTFINHIYNVYKQPLTARRNRRELYRRIRELPTYAAAVGRNEYVQELFGMGARHIIYGKMAIIFFIKNDMIYIRRIIPAALIV
ncbi:MAG: hypothetical protein LBD21_08975 [Tannerellaceae bacterium]|jgi:hypothetical protein|nr:hypothetical protein [Tannerellaceae bacterium]